MNLKQLLNSYQHKLSGQEWKVFSDRVRRNKRNTCECCKRTGTETNVHHPFYDSSREPWDYGMDEVVLLCRPCHKELHEHLNQFRKFVFTKLTPQSFRVLNGALSVALDHYDPLIFAHALAEFVSDTESVNQYAAKWGRTAVRRTEEEQAYTRFKRHLAGRIDV